MSTLIAKTPQNTDVIIPNLPFYPSISTKLLSIAVHVDFVVELGQIEQSVRKSILRINFNLASWQAQQIKNGYNALIEIPSDYTPSDKVDLYLDAIYHYTKYLLLNEYRDYDSTSIGNDKADRLEPRIQYSRDQSDRAVALLTHIKLTRVSLL